VLTLRILTVAVLLPAFAGGAFYLPSAAWALAMFGAVLLAATEWARLVSFGSAASWIFKAALATGCGLLWWQTQADSVVYFVSIAFWVAAVPLALWQKPRLHGGFVAGLAGLIVLLPMWLAAVRLQATPGLLLALLAIVWISDSAAYAAGHAWGKHKLAPSISPGKSWEGVGGAIAAVAVYAGVFQLAWFPEIGLFFVMTAFFAITVLGILGDLFESLLKRSAGVKDSGTMLPGHGGVLDRIDAITAALPLAALVFART